MAEKRLIDANALYGRLKGEHELTNGLRADVYWRGFNNGLTMAQAVVNQAPTVDAVEVVWCGLCKHWDVEGLYCHHPAGLSFCGKTGAAKGFCCFGERRTDG